MTQYEAVKKEIKNAREERRALIDRLKKLEREKLNAKVFMFILGFVLIVTNGAWFAAWSLV